MVVDLKDGLYLGHPGLLLSSGFRFLKMLSFGFGILRWGVLWLQLWGVAFVPVVGRGLGLGLCGLEVLWSLLERTFVMLCFGLMKAQLFLKS